MTPMRRRRTDRSVAPVALRLLAVAAGLALGAPAARGAGEDPYAACRAEGDVAGAQIGGPFTLVSEAGETVTDRQVVTVPTLLYFGYTFCPDVCPIDAVRNAEAVDLLAARGIDVLPVFISVDPKRDTPEVLADYTDAVHPRMLGLTGSAQQVAVAAANYGAYFRVFDDTGDAYYLVEHSTSSYLALPERGFVGLFGRAETAAQTAERIACFLAAEQAGSAG
jgi:protein SCO1/2